MRRTFAEYSFGAAMIVISLGLLGGCDSNKSRPAPTASATASAAAPASASSAAAAPKAKCEELGCGEGNGSFFEKCKCEGKPGIEVPLRATWSGKYGSFDRPEWEVENTSDKPIHWASATVYYYNGAGKQLETTVKKTTYKNFSMNGSNFSFDAKEKKTLTFGWERKSAPPGISKIEVVFDGWCYGKSDDKEAELCVRVASPPEERKQDG